MIKREVSIGGMVLYRLDGVLHNEEPNPAVIWPNGTVEFWQNGKRHGELGPAVIYSANNMEFWLHGVELTHEEWLTERYPEWLGVNIETETNYPEAFPI